MTIDDLLVLERKQRNSNKWLQFVGTVTTDAGVSVDVRLKSFGFYNQVFTVNNSVDYCAGHTINTVKDMHAHIRNVINNHRLARVALKV